MNSLTRAAILVALVLLSLQCAQLAEPGKAEPTGVSFEEKLLGSVPEGLHSQIDRVVFFSPDGRAAAYPDGQGGNWFFPESGRSWLMIVAGQPGPRFEFVGLPVFSHDGKRLAYVARDKAKWFAMIDNQRGPEFDEIKSLLTLTALPKGAVRARSRSLLFKPGGNVVAYAAKTGQKWRLIVGDDQGPEYSDIGEIVFSTDGANVAYAANEGGRWVVVHGQNRGPDFEQVDRLVFSNDGRRLAYAAKQGERRFVMVDDQRGPEFEDVGTPVFSPDGGTVAYWVREKTRTFVVVGERREEEFDSVGDLTFSPDGRTLAYAAGIGERFFLVAGNRRGPEFDYVWSPLFSADGAQLAYAAQRDNKAFVVIGDQRGPEFNNVWPRGFSEDASRLAYAAVYGRGLWWKVLDVN